MIQLLSRFPTPFLAILVAGLLPAQERDESPIGGTPAVEIVRDRADSEALTEALDALREDWGAEPGGESELGLVRDVVAEAEGKMSLADAKRLATALQKVLRQGPVLLPERSAVYGAAIDGLSRFGNLGGQVLFNVYEDERIPTRPETQGLRGDLLVGLSKTGFPKTRELLVSTIRSSSEPLLLASAGRAMRQWSDAPRAERQALVEVLARRMAGLENVASRRPGDPARFGDLVREDAEDDLKTVREVWNPVLAELTGARHRTGQAWWEWYQEHREERWPADPKDEDDGGSGRRG